MTFPEFDKFFDDFVDECRKMRDSKGKEYASSADRFANFDRLSKRLEVSNLKVGAIYLTKHLDAIDTYIKDGKVHSSEGIRGRFIDAVTYLILMAGMAEEATPLTPNRIGITTEELEFKHKQLGLCCSSRAGFICSLVTGHTGVHRAYMYHDINSQLLDSWVTPAAPAAPNLCSVEGPNKYCCTRSKGHLGRHIASNKLEGTNPIYEEWEQ